MAFMLGLKCVRNCFARVIIVRFRTNQAYSCSSGSDRLAQLTQVCDPYAGGGPECQLSWLPGLLILHCPSSTTTTFTGDLVVVATARTYYADVVDADYFKIVVSSCSYVLYY